MTTLIPVDDSEGCVGQSDAEAALERLFSLSDLKRDKRAGRRDPTTDMAVRPDKTTTNPKEDLAMPTAAAEGGPFGGGIEASAESDRPAISPEAAMGSGDRMTAATEARAYMDACTEATQAAIDDGAGPIAREHAADREMNATTAYFNVNPDADAEMDAEAAKWEAEYAAAHPDPGRQAGPQAEAG